ncbi:unnamed protein product [Symbiodinium sp. KB8]|nr:unnamed protein product [Symbiodinium sp. KB8]
MALPSLADVLAAFPDNATYDDVQQILSPALPKWGRQPRLATAVLKQVECVATVITMLDVMQGSRIETNKFHYSVAIAACDKAGDWKLAVQLLARMERHFISPDVVCFNAAIGVCEKSAEWDGAISILSLMASLRTLPDTISYNSVLGASARAGHWELALDMLYQLHRRSAADVISFSSALAACAKGTQWDAALRILASMPAGRVLPNAFSYSSAMAATANSGLWEHAVQLLSDMAERAVLADAFVYSAVTTACGRGQEWELAMLLLGRTVEESSDHAEVVFNSAISACATAAQWQPALWILASMPFPQVVSYNSAVAACGRCSLWQASISLLTRMATESLNPDEISYNSAIDACGEGGSWQLALDLLLQMYRRVIRPGEVSFTSALSATARAAKWHMCMAMLCRMGELRQNLASDAVGIAMSACEGSCAWEATLVLLESMMALRDTPDALHVGSAANALRKSLGKKRAMDLLEIMKAVWLRRDAEKSLALTRKVPTFAVSHPTVLGFGCGIVAAKKSDDVTTEVFAERIAALLWPGARSAEVLSIVSRLDRATSGVLPLALGPAGSLAANWLQSQFASRLVKKNYVCLCEGPKLGIVSETGQVTSPLRTSKIYETKRTEVSETGREALTKYRVLARYRAPTVPNPGDHELILLSVKPVTGRTHQIRVHLAHLNRPIVGDGKYGRHLSMLPRQRLFLHCRRIELRDLSGKPFCVKARLPLELRDVLASLKPLRIDEAWGRKKFAFTVLAARNPISSRVKTSCDHGHSNSAFFSAVRDRSASECSLQATTCKYLSDILVYTCKPGSKRAPLIRSCIVGPQTWSVMHLWAFAGSVFFGAAGPPLIFDFLTATELHDFDCVEDVFPLALNSCLRWAMDQQHQMGSPKLLQKPRLAVFKGHGLTSTCSGRCFGIVAAARHCAQKSVPHLAAVDHEGEEAGSVWQHMVLTFGATSSVWAYLRVADIHAAMGFRMKKSKEKPPAAKQVLLVVEWSAGQEQVQASAGSDRIEKIQQMISGVLESGEMSQQMATKLAGLCTLDSTDSPGSNALSPLRTALIEIQQVLPLLKPVQIPVQINEQRVSVLYADAFITLQGVRRAANKWGAECPPLHALVGSKNGWGLCFSVHRDKGVHFGVRYWWSHVESLAKVAPSKALFYWLEMMAQILSIAVIAPHVRGHMVCFIDNTAAEHALRKGYAKSEAFTKTLACFWSWVANTGLQLSFHRVTSAANLSDGISRGCWDEAESWGCQRLHPQFERFYKFFSRAHGASGKPCTASSQLVDEVADFQSTRQSGEQRV